MSRKRHPPTADVRQQIAAFIRAGGFPHVAAEAAGVPRRVFERWLKRGRARGAGALHRAFYESVFQAGAQARLGAEIAVLTDKPMDWLRQGPGREAPNRPGWTSPVRPAAPGKGGRGSRLAEPEVQALLASMTRLLAPYPEARALAAAGLGATPLPKNGAR